MPFPRGDQPIRAALVAVVTGCAAPTPTPIDWCVDVPAFPPGDVTTGSGGATYELYVRSFYDSDGDGIGDLAGVTAKLDYLASLGVESVWLMPVFESPSPAGYDTSDFDAVDPDYGTDADLEALFAAAAERGMRVLLDVPVNHTSSEHPWFQAELATPEEAATAALYLWSDAQWDTERWYPADDGRYYYSFFGAGLPDLNWGSVEVAARMRDALLGWLARGAGGYRVDAVVQLIEEDGAVANTDGSHCLMAWLHGEVKREYPDAVLLAEAWHKDVAGNVVWLGEEGAAETDVVIDVPRRYATLDAFSSGDPSKVAQIMRRQRDLGVADRVAPYQTSHDLWRLPDLLPDAAARRAWMALQLLSPGQPILYYGDELDLPNSTVGAGQDYDQRAPMPWNDERDAGFTEGVPWFSIDPSYLDGYNVESQESDPASMLSLVRALMALRLDSDAVLSTDTELPEVSDDGVLAVLRGAGEERVLVVVNFADTDAGAVAVETGSLPSPLVDLTSGESATPDDDGALALGDLPARAYRVLATEGLADHAIPGPL